MVENTHKLFRWGPQGILYKNGTMQLRRISRQIREYMYFFHQYTAEQLLGLVSSLRAQYDDLDFGLYKLSTVEPPSYNSGGLDIEQGGGSFMDRSSIQNNTTPLGNSLNNTPPLLNTPVSPRKDSDVSPHFHIHIDGNQNPTKNNSDSETYVPLSELPSIKKMSRVKLNDPSLPTTPMRTPDLSPNQYTGKGKEEIPTISIDEEGVIPVLIRK